MVLWVTSIPGLTQNVTNKGTDFWVAYGHHQYMEPPCSGTGSAPNNQNMTLYLSNGESQTAIVKVTIDNSSTIPNPAFWWSRTYSIPPNTVISIENATAIASTGTAGTAPSSIPKGGAADARLITDPPPLGTGGEGIFKKKGIHIESINNVPIVAYAHIYGSVSSGATMLLPTNAWGYTYTSINSHQADADRSFNWIYVIAKEDNTVVEITPSQPSRLGKPKNVPFTVTLQKGEIYQLIGQAPCATGDGVQLTGTKVRSIASAGNPCKPIAVFAGSSRTGGEIPTCGSSGRDNDMQQCFPESAWGKRYLTAPAVRGTSTPTNVPSYQNHVYKIVVKDPTTVVKRNGTIIPLSNYLANESKYYQFASSTSDYIEADKPIMLGVFMSNGSNCNSGSGDPEMIYLSPIEQAIKKVVLLRNNKEAITTNWVTLIVPTSAVASLRIDGSGAFSDTYVHTQSGLVGGNYTVVHKGWTAAPNTQVTITCDEGFNAYTYGMGGAESYGYNAGTNLNNLNALPHINNTPDPAGAPVTGHPYTYVNTPIQMSALVAYQPTRIKWKFSSLGCATITPCTDVELINPTPSATVTIGTATYYKYTLPGTYTFLKNGTFYIPLELENPVPDAAGCSNVETLSLEYLVKPKPYANFTTNIRGCGKDTIFFNGINPTSNGYNVIAWDWLFPGGVTAGIQNPAVLLDTGNHSIKLTIVVENGGIADTTINIRVHPKPVVKYGINPNPACPGPVTFSDTTVYTGPSPIINWYWDLQTNVINAPNNANQVQTYAAGDYTIKHSVKVNDYCISDTVTKTLTVAPNSMVDFTYPQDCVDGNGLAQFTANSGNLPGVTYNWDFGDPSSGAANTSTVQNPTHTYATDGTYSVTLSVVTPGCTGDSTFNVVIKRKPVLTFNALSAVCRSAAPVSVANGAVTNGVAIANQYYYDASGATTAAGLFNPSVAGAGTHTIWYVVTTAAGCKDSIPQNIVVNAGPAKPTVTTPVSYCQNATASPLIAAGDAGNTITWYTNPALTGGSTTAPTPSTVTAGTVEYYVTQTNAAGCESEADTIKVNIQPSITDNVISANQTLCEGSAANSLDPSAAPAGGDGTYNYQWQSSPDGSTWSDINGATSATYAPGNVLTTTHYRRIITSGLCNSTSNAVVITVVPALTNNNISADQTICIGETPALLDGQVPAGTGPFVYVWESSSDGLTWTPVGSGEDFQPGPLTNTTHFRRNTDNGVCNATSNVVIITVREDANGNVTAPSTICQYQSADITFVATSGTAPFEISYTITDPSGNPTTVNQVGVTNNAIFNVIPAGSAAGNYFITLNSITNSNGCIRSTGFTPINIIVTATPVVTIAPVSPVCEGETFTLTASGATDYIWAASAGSNLSSTSGSSVTATPATTGTFNFSVTGSTNGCNANSVNIDVVVNPKPTAPIVTITSYTYCQFGTATAFDATATGTNTLTWYDNAGLTGGTTSATYTPSTANAGTFTYYVTQTNNFGCESSPSIITVIVNPVLAGNTISADETLCQGGTPAAMTGTATVTGGDGTYIYQWQSSPDGIAWTDIAGATNANYSPGALADTTHFRRNVSSGQCESSSNVVVKYVFEGLGNYDISASQTICEGTAPVLLDGGAPTGAGPFTFTWQSSTDGTNWTNIPGATSEDYQPPVLSTTTHYRRTVTNGPCTATSSVVIITVDPIANGNFTAPTAICEYDAASVTYNSTIGTGPFDIEYSITNPAGATTTSTLSVNNGATINVIPTGSAPGNYIIALLSIENSNGCVRTTGFTPITITVNATPVVTIDPIAAVCVDAPRIITANGAATYLWTGNNLSSTSGSSVTATPTVAGTQTYSVIGTTNGCNSAPESIDLTVHPKPTVTINVADDEICLTEQGSFTATSSIPTGTIQNYYWDFDNGNTEVTTGTTATPQTYGTHRTYITKLYAVSAEGCSSVIATAAINVNPLPVASFTPPAFVCMPDGVATFTNTSTIPNGAALNYIWNFGDPASGSLNTSTDEDGSHVYPDSASYNVTLVATSAQGCTHQTTQSFNTFFNKPVAKFGVTPDTLCQGIQNAFFDSSFAPGSAIDSRLWTFGDGTTASGGSPTKTYLHPGTYQVKLEVTNSQGCTADVSKNIVVYLQPVIDVGPSFIVPEGTTVTFNAQTNSGALALAWTSPTGGAVSDPTIIRPTHLATADHVFVLTATGEGNCSATDTLNVKVLRPIVIPNAFSPNGDGINDTWGITNLRDYPNAVVEVFNRHGQPVFRSLGGYSKAWDGKLNGKDLPIGTYYYIIEPKNGFAKVTGYVVLVK